MRVNVSLTDIVKAIPDAQFGAASFMDYPSYYSSYFGYSATYGISPDYAYRLDQDLTTDIDAVSAKIDNIYTGSGGDIPQDYARVVYEARSFTWRTDAKKIYVIFGDAPPHAAPTGSTTLYNPWATGSMLFTGKYAPYGGDPGRDEVANTGDDLDYAQAVADAASRQIAIVGVYCFNSGMYYTNPEDSENNFRYMAYVTGGLYAKTDSALNPSDIAAQIVSMIQEMATKNIGELGLQVEESRYAGWVTTPEAYRDVPWGSSKVFNPVITAPAGTADGDYTFHIDVVGDGVVLGTVAVTEHVTGNKVMSPIKVSLDIKPGDCPNSFNIKEKGVLPAAILVDKNLKASSIDPESILLTRDGGTVGVKPIRSSLEDVGSPSTKTCSCGYLSGKDDKMKDLTLKFDSQDVVKKLGLKKNEGCIKVTVTGTLVSKDPALNGKQIQGSDYLRVLDTGSGSCGGGDSKDDKGSNDDKKPGDGKGSGDNEGSHGDTKSSDGDHSKD